MSSVSVSPRSPKLVACYIIDVRVQSDRPQEAHQRPRMTLAGLFVITALYSSLPRLTLRPEITELQNVLWVSLNPHLDRYLYQTPY
jgi:hypothetical protein